MAYCLAVHTLWDDVVALKTTIEKRASAQSQLSSRLVLYLCAKAGFVLCLPVTMTHVLLVQPDQYAEPAHTGGQQPTLLALPDDFTFFVNPSDDVVPLLCIDKKM